MGLVIGGHISIDSALFIESLPVENHSQFTILTIFYSLGSVLSSCLLFISVSWRSHCLFSNEAFGDCSFYGWRQTFFISGVLALIFFLARDCIISVRESPYFTWQKGDVAQTVETLEYIALVNGKEGEILYPEYTGKIKLGLWKEYRSSLSKTSPRIAFLSMLTFFLVNLGFTMFGSFVALLLIQKGVYYAPEDQYIDLLFYTSSALPATAAALYGIKYMRRLKPVLIFSTVSCAIGLFVFNVVNERIGVIIVTCWINFWATCSKTYIPYAVYSCLYTYVAQVFTTDVRAGMNGVCMACGRIAGIIAPLFSGYLNHVDPSFPVYTSGGVLLLAGAVMLGLEDDRTKGQSEVISVHI